MFDLKVLKYFVYILISEVSNDYFRNQYHNFWMHAECIYI